MIRPAKTTVLGALLTALLVGPRLEASASRPPDLACRLDAEPGAVVGGPVKVRFTLSNRSSRAVRVLRWHTPLEGFWSDVLDVTYDGKKLAYEGPLMKRGDPVRDDYIEIAPGRPVTAVVDLAGPYHLRRPGIYRVAFTRGLMDVVRGGEVFPRGRGEHRRRSLACEEVEIVVAAATPG